MQLSPKQNKVLEEIQQFLQSEQQCFVLKGYAGTGKTSLMSYIVKYLKKQNLPFRLIAPTGRAAKNIINRLSDENVVASTIHSFIYERALQQESEEDDNNDLRLIFNLKKLDLDSNLVVIVDEASMISHVKQEQDTLIFGSGNLLVDLFRFMDFDNGKRKIIFVGDNLQLPPVSSSESVALNPIFLEPYFSTPIGHAELTEVFRQDAGGLLNSATNLRDEMLRGTFNHLPIVADDEEIFNMGYRDALHKYQLYYGKESIFIAERNRDVHQLNMGFREKQALRCEILEPKERLILMRNSWIEGIRVYNGDFLFVTKIGSIESKTVTLNKKGGGVEKVTLQFQDITVGFYDEENRPHGAECKILLSKLWDEESSFTKEDRQALITLFTKEHPEIKRGSREYKEMIRRDPYFNALYVRFGYAITCHKAQGGEWDNVFSLVEMSRSLYCLDSFRWLYTALTRAKKSITFVDLPRSYAVFDPTDSFCIFRPIFVEKLVELGYTVLDEKKIDYASKFTLQKEGKTAVLCVYYTAKNTLGAARKEKGTLEVEDILEILKDLKGHKLSEVVSF